MSRICRTCLQKSNTTFRTSQVLGDFGEGAVRISVVLRYCIPELYLGLSLNPEICLTCKENLKVAYLFKKRCISTENTIGNFLKSTRSTGQCVDLHDVLAFMNGKGQQIQLDIRQATDVTNVANKIPSKPAESTVVSTEASQVVGVNPVVAHPISQGSLISINNGTSFIIQPGMLSQIFGQSINNQTVGILQRIDNPNILPSTQNVDDPNNVCKISNISSMDSNQLIIKNDLNSTITNVIEHSIAHEELTIKDEPLDIEPNSAEPSVPLETDEETLDASETASYPETHVEGFLEDVPEGNFQDQYVDVPDFVTINNFGFKELEELRQQQQMEKEKLDENASLPNPDASNLNKGDNAVEEIDISEKEVDNSVDAMAELPDVLYIDGKRMVKCANGYRQAASDDSTTVIQEENLLAHVIQVPEKSKPSSARKRNRRKIKIVAVGDQPEGKKFKSNTSIAPKPNDSDVVVLFTSYTMDCMYINDHDYLISPYRRNKILFEENCRWMCMCHICHSSHTVTDHVKHMSMHGSKCKLCLAELGTPYMHNIHLRVHKKACRYCTQVLPYAQLKSHEATHEREILEDAGYTGRKRKRKPNKDEKPVYFAISKPEETNSDTAEESQSDEPVKLETTEENLTVERTSEEEMKTYSNRRGRPRRKPVVEDSTEILEPSRRLRTRVKKLYAESDEEGDGEEQKGSSSG